MKLGIVGTGKIVQELLPVIVSLKPEKCYLAGRSHSAERTKFLYQKYHLDGYFLDYDAMLQTNIDTVYIALPNHLHFSYARHAIAAGKHVIVEKPIVPTMKELEELENEAGENRVFLFENMSTPHLPAFSSMQEQIQKLGEIRLADFQFYQYSSRYDAFLRGEISPVFDPKSMGGALMDLNVYNLYAIVTLFGKPKNAVYYPQMKNGVDISGLAVLDYGTFVAAASAGKNAQSSTHSVIVGEQAAMEIPVPMNTVDRYEMTEQKGVARQFQYDKGEHRLSFAFREFARIIMENDVQRANELLKASRMVTELLEQLRPY